MKCWCCRKDLEHCECQNDPMDHCMGCGKCNSHCECVQILESQEPVIPGVGPDAPTTENEQGGKQSDSPYRCDLLPSTALLKIANVLKQGAKKYGENNWRRITQKEHLNHAITHLLAFMAGDRQDDHVSHAACRALFAMETQ